MTHTANSELIARFQPVLDDIVRRSTVAETFLDRPVYRLYIATLWANLVLDPDGNGVLEDDLEDIHDLLNDALTTRLGSGESLKRTFEFINSKEGERAMSEAQMTQNHKDLLLYIASIILDPEGHKKWVEHIREELD